MVSCVFSEMLHIENLILAIWGLFNISKVSSREIQRHRRVMGDADSSVNSAGGWAQDALTRCSRWQQWWSRSVPNVLYLPNNAAGRRSLVVTGKTALHQKHWVRHTDMPHISYRPCEPWRTKHKKKCVCTLRKKERDLRKQELAWLSHVKYNMCLVINHFMFPRWWKIILKQPNKCRSIYQSTKKD